MLSLNLSSQSDAVVRSAAACSIACFAAMSVPFAASAALLAAILWSTRSVESALKSLSLAVLVKTINPALVGDQFGPVSLLSWLVLAVAGGRIVLSHFGLRQPISRLVVRLALFGLVVATCSLFVSDFIAVSLFKLLSFLFAAVCILGGGKYLAAKQTSLLPWFVGMWLSVVVLSLATLATPSVAYFRDGQGFQGVLNHPQAVFCAPAVAWTSAAVFMRGLSAGHVAWVTFALACVALLLTRGRTGVAAMALAGAAVLAIAMLGHNHWRGEIARAALKGRAVFIVFALLTAIAAFPAFFLGTFQQFVLKGQTEKTIDQAFESSRGFLIDESLRNFAEQPWLGIGFGLSRSEKFDFVPTIEPISGLPLSASTEKPNLVMALLEETGLVGLVSFLPFFLALIRQILRRADLQLAWMLFTALAVNVGETVFFSMGGLGLYTLLLVGVGIYESGESRYVLKAQPR